MVGGGGQGDDVNGGRAAVFADPALPALVPVQRLVHAGIEGSMNDERLAKRLRHRLGKSRAGHKKERKERNAGFLNHIFYSLYESAEM
jgi:hypothetical protein